MEEIAIVGAGGFGREVAMLLEQINQTRKTWEIIGFFDDGVAVGTQVYGYNVLGGIEELNRYDRKLHVIFAIADPKTKRSLVARVANPKVHYPVLVHPSVLISEKDLKIGEGSIITAGNILTVNIEIGKHVILNLACTVGHDTKIGDFCSVMPAVNISGEVAVGEGVYLGTGAKIINQIKIGANTIIGAGAVVTQSLPANCTAVGIPAKPVKFHL